MTEKENSLGLSKKTNITIAAMTALSVSQHSVESIIGICIVAALGILTQGLIDFIKIRKGIPNGNSQ